MRVGSPNAIDASMATEKSVWKSEQPLTSLRAHASLAARLIGTTGSDLAG